MNWRDFGLFTSELSGLFVYCVNLCQLIYVYIWPHICIYMVIYMASVLLRLRLGEDCVIVQANNGHATFSLEITWTLKEMASNLDYAEDIEEAKAYMAKKNVFQLFEVRETLSLCFRKIRCNRSSNSKYRSNFDVEGKYVISRSFSFSVLVL